LNLRDLENNKMMVYWNISDSKRELKGTLWTRCPRTNIREKKLKTEFSVKPEMFLASVLLCFKIY
jgi:hypothetical protein